MTTPGDDQWVFLIDSAWQVPEPAAQNTGEDTESPAVGGGCRGLVGHS
ncbi:hypothetical protein SAMN04488564_12319 [Lentzea waywayandensis]|uniref:Uncharacterized protein n=1 Tax=Lentzea waywayandensis TaxID=84724 RepID=A0A1I6FJ44_9PSEU|nr:hypothetical protein SAMN04488564_12319 [Lentzea waywayandensis]